MSSLSTWRQLQLFDFTPIRDPNYQSHEQLYSDPTLSAINATKTYLIIAVNNSVLKIIDPKSYTSIGQFQAYDIDYRITFIEPLQNSSNLVVTLAEKQGFPSVIKLWDISKILNIEGLEESEYKFKFQTQVIVNNSGSEGIADNSFPISCFKFNYDLTCLAVGYTSGKVILIRGDLLRDRGAKQRVVYESVANDPITGIQFNENEQLLYLTTTSKILTVTTTGRNQGKPLRILSQKTGADLNCIALSHDQNLIVAFSDSIAYYDSNKKLKTINFQIPKSKLVRFGQFLVMVSPQENEGSKLQTRIIILDSKNSHISFNLLIPNSAIKFIFRMANEIYLLSNDGVLYKLFEKPINSQIETILERELYTVAFNLAKQSKLPTSTLLKIQKLHGNHLYEEQKYEEAIDIYIKCLDLFDKNLEDDQEEFIMDIVTKFKDATIISCLVQFLNRLYEKSIANIDHITLLLCCLCKLKRTDELDTFIDNFDLSIDNLQNLNFQLIINLFKECGFYNQVLKLLHKLNQPNFIVDLQLYDLKKPKLALNYMKSLNIDDLLLILIEHSKTLLDSCPIETTELLINVFTGKYKPKETEEAVPNGIKSGHNNHEEKESTIELTNYEAFLNYLTLRGGGEEGDKGSGEVVGDEGKKVSTDSENAEPTYLPPKPNLIYSSFTNHINEFVIFLEACIETFDRYQGNIVVKKEVLITLLELYLSLYTTTQKKEWFDKAQGLSNQYHQLLDNKSLLLLSHIYDFKPGEIKVKEDNGDEESLFMSYQINEDIQGCFKILEKFGETKPSLYKMMLEFVISKKSIFEKVNSDDLQVIIRQIKYYKLFDPLELLDLLTATNQEYFTFGILRNYLLDVLSNQQQEINNNEKLIEMYEQESVKSSIKISELTNRPFIIQNNKCSLCKSKLDFPMVHFKCKHSFHQKCLSTNLIASNNGNQSYLKDDEDSKPKCPLCIQNINEMKYVKNMHYKLKDQYDLFASSLHESNDKFKFVADSIGKGVMEEESMTFDS
ncbi:vps11 [Candida oxycetoniae]|uniref:E3 ubiquitin-protein ligase PEP5 n=1 Tax=Candida oxycetoniae TaxID=497107 RepID=A0AAI9T112_9ASCO|nr:vps11 [Candida oxycetoniae]KAI3406642.2 vps11 [Candida oxycetoniae]